MPRDIKKISRFEAELFENIKCHLFFFFFLDCWRSVESPLGNPRYQLCPMIQKLKKPNWKTANRTGGPNSVCLYLRQICALIHWISPSFLQESVKHRCGCASISCLLGDIQSDHSRSDKLWGQAEHIKLGLMIKLSKSGCLLEAYLYIYVWCPPTGAQAWPSHTA